MPLQPKNPFKSPLDKLIHDIAGGEGHSLTIRDSLCILSAISRSGMVLLPDQPTDTMLAAGAQAGNVTPETVRSILQAVIKATE